MKPIIGFAATLMLTACATAPSIDTADLAEFMEGHFIAGEPGVKTYFHDKRVRIVPLGDGEWLYYQINRGADDSVYRQRVLHLEPLKNGQVQQTAYTLKSPEKFSDMGQVLKTIALDDLDTAFTEGCEMIWTAAESGWDGKVDPQDCVIFSERRQSELRIGSKSKLTKAGLRQGESGYQLDGTYLWGTKGDDDLYELIRQ